MKYKINLNHILIRKLISLWTNNQVSNKKTIQTVKIKYNKITTPMLN